MATKLAPKEMVTFRDALLSEMIQFEALVNLLDRQGIIDKEELLEEIKRVHATMLKAETWKDSHKYRGGCIWMEMI